MVAVHQPVSRHVGTERLQADLSALRRVRDPRAVRAGRRRQKTKDKRQKIKDRTTESAFEITVAQPFRAARAAVGWAEGLRDRSSGGYFAARANLSPCVLGP